MHDVGDENFTSSTVVGDSSHTIKTEETPLASPPVVPQAPTPEESSLAEASELNQEVLPTKKMLRVRPDGKLSSPKSNGRTRSTRRKGASKSSTDGPAGKALLVAVQYGAGNGFFSDLGQKIDNILSGKAIKSKPGQAYNLKNHEPAKATHPFFLGGIVKSTGIKDTALNENPQHIETNVPVKKTKSSTSPRKARIISKPAGPVEDGTTSTSFGRPTFGSDHARLCRFPGALEPLWPPRDILNVGLDYTETASHFEAPHTSPVLSTRRKMKSIEVKVPAEEQVLTAFTRLVNAHGKGGNSSQRGEFQKGRGFRRPLRRLMSGLQLQREVQKTIEANLAIGDQPLPEHEYADELALPQPAKLQSPQVHGALRCVHDQIPGSLTAFDRFTCEAQDWVRKYAPKSADEVLQSGPETLILRDWLRTLTVHSTEDRSSWDTESLFARKMERRVYKRKRRKAEGLDGFVISSDEEADELDEITGPVDESLTDFPSKRSMIRGGKALGDLTNDDRSANAVVISGPHGCGKTAAVYAVAQELGFEVFEINAGSRRSGRDLLDRIGDMTRNHLVKHDPEDRADDARTEREESEITSKRLKHDIESGRQGTVNSFFKSKPTSGKSQSSNHKSTLKASPKKKPPPPKPSNQKQSLILLEEVDVLFEVDKSFWPTALELMAQSKRPFIMTCTDESLVPLEDMMLYAVLRFTQAPQSLAIDYLSLIAGNEGHLLTRQALSTLYKAKQCDLRASLSELNFFCQMAIGDTRGGLDWMLIKTSSDTTQEHGAEPIRVVSQDTYEAGMGWLDGDFRPPKEAQSLAEECTLLSEAWNGWGIDIGASATYLQMSPAESQCTSPKHVLLKSLNAFDTAYEALSAADTFPSSVSRYYDRPSVETASAGVFEEFRSQYIEGLHVIKGDIVSDQSGLSESISMGARACARRLTCHTPSGTAISNTDQMVLDLLPCSGQPHKFDVAMTRRMLLAAFDPIARLPVPALGIPKGPQSSALDSPMSVIVEDIAPYIRAIVSYDTRLEQQRERLSSLLSGPGPKGKKQRTTRASRAALEGGQKASTRRERWFPEETKFNLVGQSGDPSWQHVLERLMGDA